MSNGQLTPSIGSRVNVLEKTKLKDYWSYFTITKTTNYQNIYSEFGKSTKLFENSKGFYSITMK